MDTEPKFNGRNLVGKINTSVVQNYYCKDSLPLVLVWFTCVGILSLVSICSYIFCLPFYGLLTKVLFSFTSQSTILFSVLFIYFLFVLHFIYLDVTVLHLTPMISFSILPFILYSGCWFFTCWCRCCLQTKKKADNLPCAVVFFFLQ